MQFTILVPTDFSPTAEKAYQYALDIAFRSSGSVFLFHVYTPLENPFIETVDTRQEYNLENEKALMDRLHSVRAKWASQYPGVKVTTVLGRSPLVGSILKFTDDEDISLIVMGTQGATGLKKVIVGTIAARILEKTKVPLLLVPELFKWKEPKKLLMATNYYAADNTALHVSGKISNLYDANIEIIHFSDVSENMEESQWKFDGYILDLGKTLPGKTVDSRLIPVSSVIDAFDTLHEVIPYDILVLVMQKRSFLDRIFRESRTKHMAYLTRIPLLVIPAEKEME